MLFKTLCIYLEVIIMDNVLLLSIQPQNLQNIDKTMNCELFWIKFKIKSWFLGPMADYTRMQPTHADLRWNGIFSRVRFLFSFFLMAGLDIHSTGSNHGSGIGLYGIRSQEVTHHGELRGGLYISIAHGSLLCHVIPTHWDILRDISNIHFKCE